MEINPDLPIVVYAEWSAGIYTNAEKTSHGEASTSARAYGAITEPSPTRRSHGD